MLLIKILTLVHLNLRSKIIHVKQEDMSLCFNPLTALNMSNYLHSHESLSVCRCAEYLSINKHNVEVSPLIKPICLIPFIYRTYGEHPGN